MSVELLGFTLYWGRSRRGYWVMKAKTSRGRVNRALCQAGQWCRQHRHRPLRWQWEVLSRKLNGHYAYFGVTGNHRALGSVYEGVLRRWQKWLQRRNGHRSMRWPRMLALLEQLTLPRPRIVHSSVSQRTHMLKSRMR